MVKATDRLLYALEDFCDDYSPWPQVVVGSAIGLIAANLFISHVLKPSEPTRTAIAFQGNCGILALAFQDTQEQQVTVTVPEDCSVRYIQRPVTKPKPQIVFQ